MANDNENEATPPQEYYKATAFFPIVDRVKAEMERRFTDNDCILRGISASSPASDEFLCLEAVKPVCDAYGIPSSIDAQIEVCKTYLKNVEQKISDKSKMSMSSTAQQPTLPQNIAELITCLKPAEGFPDLRRLLQIALTIPIANVSAERLVVVIAMIIIVSIFRCLTCYCFHTLIQ